MTTEDQTPTLPYFLPMEQGTRRAHLGLVVPVSDEVTTEAEDAHYALETLVHFYADLVDADPVDVLRNLLDTIAGDRIPDPDPDAWVPVTPLVGELAQIATRPVAIVDPGEDDRRGDAWVVICEDVAFLRDFGEDDGAALKFAALVALTRDYAATVDDHFAGVLTSLAENLDDDPKGYPLTQEACAHDGERIAHAGTGFLNDGPATLCADCGATIDDPFPHDGPDATELADQADDRCGYCGEVVDRSTPDGEAIGRTHDDGLCRPSSAGSRIAAADELLRSAEALEGPRWTAAVAEYLRVVGYQIGDRVAIGTDPRFVIVGTVVGVLDRDAGYLVRPANGIAVPVRRDELRPIVADLLASAGTVVDAAPAGSPA